MSRAFFDALVKAAAGFFAQPAAASHLFDQRGNAVEFARFVAGSVVVDIADDVGEHVEADDIGGAKSGRLGPADGGAGAGVHFFDGHAEAGHERERSEHGERADAVGDEVGSVLGAHHAFAQAAIAEIAERVENFRRSGRAGNQFDQLHVTRRVEEMRAGPMVLKLVGKAFGDLPDGKAGGVGGDDGAGAAMRQDFLQQAALDGQIFGDGFDDPVGLGAPGEVVLEIADGDARGRGGREEGGGARLQGGFEAGANDAVADARVGERKAAGLFLGGELGRDDVQQPAGDAGVGQMSGDAGAHGSGAEDGDTFDLRAGFHGVGGNSLEFRLLGG